MLRCVVPPQIHIFIRMYSLGLGEEYPSRECAHNNILTKRYNSVWGPYAIRSTTYKLGHAKVVRYPGVWECSAAGKASSVSRRWTEILNVLIWSGNLSCWLIVFAFRFTRTITHTCVSVPVYGSEWGEVRRSEQKEIKTNDEREESVWMGEGEGGEEVKIIIIFRQCVDRSVEQRSMEWWNVCMCFAFASPLPTIYYSLLNTRTSYIDDICRMCACRCVPVSASIYLGCIQEISEKIWCSVGCFSFVFFYFSSSLSFNGIVHMPKSLLSYR